MCNQGIKEKKQRRIGLIYTPKDPERCSFIEFYQIGDHHPKFEAVLTDIKELVPNKLAV